MEPEVKFIIYKARKKPVEIECIRLLPGEDRFAYDQWTSIIDWVSFCGGTINAIGEGDEPYVMEVLTADGNFARLKPGDWMMRGVKGEFYPCQDDIFQQSHELVI